MREGWRERDSSQTERERTWERREWTGEKKRERRDRQRRERRIWERERGAFDIRKEREENEKGGKERERERVVPYFFFWPQMQNSICSIFMGGNRIWLLQYLYSLSVTGTAAPMAAGAYEKESY